MLLVQRVISKIYLSRTTCVRENLKIGHVPFSKKKKNPFN